MAPGMPAALNQRPKRSESASRMLSGTGWPGSPPRSCRRPTAGKGSNTDDVLDDHADAVGRIGRARFQAKEDEHRQGNRRSAAGQCVDYAGDDAGENREKIL